MPTILVQYTPIDIITLEVKDITDAQDIYDAAVKETGDDNIAAACVEAVNDNQFREI